MKDHPIKFQCTVITGKKTRCTRIAQHFTGQQSLCTEHLRTHVANSTPIKRKEKK